MLKEQRERDRLERGIVRGGGGGEREIETEKERECERERERFIQKVSNWSEMLIGVVLLWCCILL